MPKHLFCISIFLIPAVIASCSDRSSRSGRGVLDDAAVVVQLADGRPVPSAAGVSPGPSMPEIIAKAKLRVERCLQVAQDKLRPGAACCCSVVHPRFELVQVDVAGCAGESSMLGYLSQQAGHGIDFREKWGSDLVKWEMSLHDRAVAAGIWCAECNARAWRAKKPAMDMCSLPRTIQGHGWPPKWPPK